MPNQFRMRPWLALIILATAINASAEWNEKVLYSFQGGTDGAFPAGGVVFDKQGNLYGATQQGGGTNCSPMAACGTVYQLVPPAKQGAPWTENVLHIFQGKQHNDGEFPSGGVIADALGNIYGTASYGGTGDCILLGIKGGCGTVFELSPPPTKSGQWTYTILYSFKSGKDGYLPLGNLVFDGAGNLYGATYFGGGKGTTCNPDYQYCGTVFELSPPKTKGGKWTEKVLYSFKGAPAGAQFGDGANPNGGLVLDKKGAIYGTTYFGGNNVKGECEGGSGGTGCGIVFALQPPTTKGGTWKEKVLHRFNGQDGDNPAAGVVFRGNGALYCTTVGGGGGNFPSGTVVRLVRHSDGTWTEHMLYSFQDNGDGGGPRSGLVFDSEGDVYGTATGGGTVGNGTLFQLRPTGDSWVFTPLYSFAVRPDGAYPTGLILNGTGNIFGTTQYGGNGQACGNYGCGTVFMAKP
jgi:uncharacterized repeat protein (TIGR03803 family)